jgi:hypothetical protein
MSAEKNRLWWLQAIFVCLIFILIISLMILRLRAGIRVTVLNAGTKPLRSVMLHVTGSSYDLGSIAPGASAEAIVNPNSESHLEVEFEDIDGQVRRLNAGGYFESGYRGTIRVSIGDNEIEKNEQDIKIH